MPDIRTVGSAMPLVDGGHGAVRGVEAAQSERSKMLRFFSAVRNQKAAASGRGRGLRDRLTRLKSGETSLRVSAALRPI